MQEDEAALIFVIGLLIVLVVFGLVAVISNKIKSILVDIGMPATMAGDLGALIFAGISLLIILGLVTRIISQ